MPKKGKKQELKDEFASSFGCQKSSMQRSNNGFSFGGFVVREYPRSGIVVERSPGPAANPVIPSYATGPSSMSTQSNSTKRSNTCYQFSNEGRFPSEFGDSRRTGPSGRPDLSSIGKQAVSGKISSTSYGFSKASRFA